MNKEFVPYELAIDLKTLGFDDQCICGYDNEGRLRSKLAHSNDKGARIDWDRHDIHIPAMLWQQAFEWLRKKYCIHVEIITGAGTQGTAWYGKIINDWNITNKGSGNFDYFTKEIRMNNEFEGYKSYEETRLECLKKIIEVINNR